MTIHWKPVEQYFTVVLFDFNFYPVSNLGKSINFGLGTVSSERLNVFHSCSLDRERHLRLLSWGMCFVTTQARQAGLEESRCKHKNTAMLVFVQPNSYSLGCFFVSLQASSEFEPNMALARQNKPALKAK